MRNIVTGLALAALLGAAGLARSAAADEATAKIGAVVSKSGWMAPYDFPPYQAALLAVDDINAKGGLLGKKIEILMEDEKTDRALASRLAHGLVDKGVVMMIVACDYDEGAPAALVATAANILAFSTCAGDPKMGPQGLGSMAFSGATGAGNQAYAMAEWGYNKKGWRNAYTLLDTSLEFHKGADGFFKLIWKQLPGAKLVGADTFFQEDPTIASQISKIKALGSGIDVIWISSHTPGFASAIRQIRAAGIKTPIMTGDSLDGNYWISAAPDASDVYYAGYCSIFGDDPRPRVATFLADYTKKFGAKPETCFSLPGYSLIEAWALAVQRAKTFDTKEVVAQLEKFHGEDLLAGATSFTPTAHLQLDRPIIVMQVQGGKFSTVGPYQNKMVPPIDYRNPN
jgi:branched-chain amino acid transport system substrate-binding protein